jgi:hypothetical protein
MTQEKAATRDAPNAKEAAQATDLLRTVASTLNERLAVTAGELARSQDLLRPPPARAPNSASSSTICTGPCSTSSPTTWSTN